MKILTNNSPVSMSDIKQLWEENISYKSRLVEVLKNGGYEEPEASLNLPSDDSLLDQVKALKNKFESSKLKYILDIGIGGSNLGTKAVYDALFGYFDLIEPGRSPKIIFLDTVDPEFLDKLSKFLETVSEEEILVNAISKSGGTTETTANLEIVLAVLKNRFENPNSRVVITTDFESKLWNKARELGIETLSIPKTVGGRYSVFSTVGLFPLSFLIDIEELRQGARDAIATAINTDIAESSNAFVSAAVLFLSSKSGLRINDNFFFHPELESIGKWYRQLMGESIGKEENLSGEKVFAGITPTVSIGSTDLHSVGQLYLGGPKDKITTFVSAEKREVSVSVPENLTMPGLVEHIQGKNAAEIMGAILQGVKIAYQKKDRAFMEVLLDDLSVRSLGEFLQFKMIEMMFLGQLLSVNPFDQPNVEDYKVETKNILSQP